MFKISSLGKWLAGIAATIIGALVIWSFTHPGGYINPVREPMPDVKIIDLTVTNAVVGQTASANVTAYNQGDITAEECVVDWWSGNQMSQYGEPNKYSTSAEFGLRPKETRQISATSLVYTQIGTFKSRIAINCKGLGIGTLFHDKDVIVVQRP
jgi:hypothetical protein